MTCCIVIRNGREEEGGEGCCQIDRQTDGQTNKLSINVKLNFGANPDLMQKIIIFDWLHSVSSGIASFG